jgi:hypothetical protein
MMLFGGATIMGSTIAPLEGLIGLGPCPAVGHYSPEPLVVEGEHFFYGEFHDVVHGS